MADFTLFGYTLTKPKPEPKSAQSFVVPQSDDGATSGPRANDDIIVAFHDGSAPSHARRA